MLSFFRRLYCWSLKLQTFVLPSGFSSPITSYKHITMAPVVCRVLILLLSCTLSVCLSGCMSSLGLWLLQGFPPSLRCLRGWAVILLRTAGPAIWQPLPKVTAPFGTLTVEPELSLISQSLLALWWLRHFNSAVQAEVRMCLQESSRL